jgi:hypothetical protein
LSGALIITAGLGPADQARFDRLRNEHFPPERNYLTAHLTMFHALPPSSEAEVRAALGEAAIGSAPAADVAGLIDLGGGVAFRIRSAELERIRADLSDRFHGLLTAQDSGGWRPHITIQNKVPPSEARKLRTVLEAAFKPRPLAITSLDLHRYLGGQWKPIRRYPFRGLT